MRTLGDGPRRRTRLACLVAAGFALAALAMPTAVSGDDATARVQAGVRLFRSLLAADMGLARRVDAEGRLVVLVFYASDAGRAEGVARQLMTPGEGQPAPTIRDLPLAFEITSDPAFSAYQEHAPAAVFIAEPPSNEALQRIVRYGIEHRVIVYSPFEGHVEKGVLGGISIEAKVQPYLNERTLAASGVELKPFFLKVSKLVK
jgi:hypothetical protein